MKATKSLVNKIEEIKQLEMQMNALKNKIDALKNQVKEKFGDDEELVYKDMIILTYKFENRTTLDSTRLKKEKPDLYKEYSKTSTIRRFLIK